MNTLAKLAELENEIRKKSLAEKLQKQGFQLNLQEMYKPLIASQQTTSGDIKDTIIQRLNTMSNIDNTRWLQFIETFKSYPDTVRNISAIRDSLEAQLMAIINEIKAGNTNIDEQIQLIIKKQSGLREIMRDMSDKPNIAELLPLLDEYPKIVNEIISPSLSLSRLNEDERQIYYKFRLLNDKDKKIIINYYRLFKKPELEPIHEEKPIDESIDIDEPIDIDADKASQDRYIYEDINKPEIKNNPNALAKYLWEENSARNNRVNINILNDYIINHNIKVDLSTDPWRTLKNHEPLLLYLARKRTVSSDEESKVYVNGLKKLNESQLKLNLVADPLLEYIRNNPKTNLGGKLWTTIHRLEPELFEQFEELKKRQKPKVGTGVPLVEFLPDNTNELLAELTRMIGSYKSGNKGLFNEINSVIDELRRKGVFGLNNSKKLYKLLN